MVRIMRNHGNGFTVVELLVTVAIISILSAIAFRPFANFYNSQRLKYTAIELAGYIRTARAIALKDGGVCQLAISGTTIAPSSLSGNKCTTGKPASLDLSSHSGAPGIEIVTPIPATISFVRHGFMAGSSETIRIKSSGSSTEWCINILSPSALVRVGHAEGSATCNYVTG